MHENRSYLGAAHLPVDRVDLVVRLTGGIGEAVVIVSVTDLLDSIAVEIQFFVGISSPGDRQVSE